MFEVFIIRCFFVEKFIWVLKFRTKDGDLFMRYIAVSK